MIIKCIKEGHVTPTYKIADGATTEGMGLQLKELSRLLKDFPDKFVEVTEATAKVVSTLELEKKIPSVETKETKTKRKKAPKAQKKIA
jgi:hypothetical protein